MYTQLTLPQIFDEADAIARDVQFAFGHLNAEQLNWKPSANSWSVAQCLNHLMSANREMLPAFDKAIGGTVKARFFERVPFLPGLFGRMMINVVAPEGKRKLKAPRAAIPSTSAVDPRIVGQFVAHQQEVISKMKAIQNLNPATTNMTSPFVGFITYSLLDACRIIVAHERRHFAQAKRVTAMSGFPK
jgi:hypothetical protein